MLIQCSITRKYGSRVFHNGQNIQRSKLQQHMTGWGGDKAWLAEPSARCIPKHWQTVLLLAEFLTGTADLKYVKTSFPALLFHCMQYNVKNDLEKCHDSLLRFRWSCWINSQSKGVRKIPSEGSSRSCRVRGQPRKFCWLTLIAGISQLCLSKIILSRHSRRSFKSTVHNPLISTRALSVLHQHFC